MIWPAIVVNNDYVVAQMNAGMRMPTIHQGLQGEHSLAASAPSQRRSVAVDAPEKARWPQVAV